MERPPIVEDQMAGELIIGCAEGAGPSTEVQNQTSGDGKIDPNPPREDNVRGEEVFLTVHERRIGLFARAFSFPTDVSHEKLEANLHAGLLRIKVPKKASEVTKQEHKEVAVKHSGA
jgi:hypothetical protein